MYCKACGASNAPDLKVCSACGLELNSGGTTLDISLTKEEIAEPNIPIKFSKKPQLVVLKGPNSGMHFILKNKNSKIGRESDSDIFLNDVTVSRKHAIINKTEANYSVADTGSLNGTYVNGERKDEYILSDGDELQIGRYRLLFVSGK